MEGFNDNQIILLEELAEEYNILVVTDRLGTFKPEVYSVGGYNWATDRNPYLSFDGWKKITGIIADHSIYSNNPNTFKTIITQIETGMAATSRLREFSASQFSWMKF